MAFTTLPSAGSKLRASTVTSLITELRPISVVKTADTSRNSTIARTADPDLTIALPVNSSWEFELVIIVTTDANAAGDFSGEMAFPAGAVIQFAVHGLDLALPSGQSADLHADISTRDGTSPSGSFDYGAAITDTGIILLGVLEMGSTAGNLTLNWAQQASNINNTNVRNGSYLTAHRIS